MNDKKTLKSQQNRLSLPIKKPNQTTKPSKYMTKANKTVLIIFLPMLIYALTRPLPLPITKCHTERTPSLKRDVINEWPLTGNILVFVSPRFQYQTSCMVSTQYYSSPSVI